MRQSRISGTNTTTGSQERSNLSWLNLLRFNGRIARFNPWRGCTRVSEGCRFCYAEVASKRNPNVLGIWGPQGTRPLAAESYWRQPLAWNRHAERDGRRHRVFCCSLADVFEDWDGQMSDGNGCPLWLRNHQIHEPIPTHTPSEGYEPYRLEHARRRLWQLIACTHSLDWLLVTKRPENMRQMTPPSWNLNWPINVLAMTSVENQEYADRRIHELLKVPATVRGLSVEPLLGPVDLTAVRDGSITRNVLTGSWESNVGQVRAGSGPVIHWVIIGGESGPHARPCHVEWVRDLVRQCREAGTKCFVKQLGSRPVCRFESADTGVAGFDTSDFMDLGDGLCSPIGLDPKGGDPDEWSEDLRVREFPDCTSEV